MKVKELLNGIQEILKKHPEWENYDLYNLDEQSYNFSLGFISPNSKSRFPEVAEGDVSNWEQQQWFYDANNMDPPDDVKNQWAIEKLEKDTINYLIKDRQNEISFTKMLEPPTPDREIKCGDVVSHYEYLYYGKTNVVVQMQFLKNTAIEYQDDVWPTLFNISQNAINPFVNCQWTEETNDAIECKIRDELLEWDGNKYNIHFDVTLAKNRPVEVEILPPELGGTPVFFVLFKVR